MSSAVAVIHVVDDDPSFLAAVSRLLRASGFAVKTFQSATGFLSCLSAETHGCLIADLSDVDGVELQEALRSEEHTSELQSLTNLVCRLLLEKKNKKILHYINILTIVT